MTATEALLDKPIPRRRPRRWPSWMLAIFTAIVLVDAIFGEAGYIARVRARGHYERQVARIAAIRLENRALQERRRRLETDAAAIEEAARKDLGLLRRGEIVFRINDRRQP